ncbi:DNA polymerase III subunit gamma/tau [Candidatus Nanopelagicus abundans]|uniref:DNA polymerase III subunit gamma/tau n=1 Tax=Candidatus Nanopelagicus abundans TaxID=1884916 RepID=A0A249L5I1_9ACTN|nr:DNA polymerase III subunit gamma and tau [Candidatus Nanopelagicus abundans]ASY24358.1 DNA polymerase III subunit gamma/tau [Candidatus Nanopelagicus abundans]
MSLALYRKYRPSIFADVIGQEHVTTPLSNALESGKIHHAYLFSGPRGCGKTSSARIMARSLNCEKGPTPNPCGICQSCKDLVANGPGSLDVIELDAATHGLVDDARDLRDKAFFAPVSSRYKIYIIDEAHQLGPGAANALLKVVEEPPAHVLFIFATTEPDKLISTIRSRTHHYPFRLVPPVILNLHLEKICASEGIKVAKGVISLVVRASGGSVRDSLSILGQLLAGAGSDGVTYEIAVALLGYTDSALIDEALDAIAAQDSASLFTTIDRVIESGQDPKRFASDLLERMRDLIIVGASDENNSAILISLPTDQLDRIRTQAKLIGIATLIRSADLIAQGLTQMRGATPPRLILELICGQMMLPTGDNVNITARIEKLEKSSSLITPSHPTQLAVIQSAPIKEAKPVKEVVDKVVESKPIENKPASNKPSGSIDITSLRRMWPQVIDSVKGKRRLTWSLLATSAQILSLDDENITIGIVNSGAKDSFVRSESDVILSDAFEEVTGVRRKILATVDSSVTTTTMTRNDEDPGDKDMLSGADLLASKLGAKVIAESN